MSSAARSYVTASASILGAGVLAITPIAAAPPSVEVADPAVQLSAATVNGLVATIANIPANEVKGLQLFADALAENGSIWVFGPDNLLGWDVGDFSFGDGIVAALVPIPALAGPIAHNLNIVLNAELPASPSPDVGCQGVPTPCPDPIGQIESQFQVPIRDLIASGALQPFKPIEDFIDSLDEPATLEPLPTVGETVKAVTGVATGLVGFINPFVPGSTWRPTMGEELRVAIQGWIARYSQQPSGIAPLTASPGTFSPPTTLVQGTGIDPDTTITPKVDAGKAFEQAATRALSAAYAGKQKAADDADADTDTQQLRTAFSKPSSLIRGGNKSEPGKVGVGVAGEGGQKARATVAGAVKSVNDKISSAVDKATDGLKRADAKTEAKHRAAPAGDEDN